MNRLYRIVIALLLLAVSATNSRPVSEENVPHERRARDLGTLTSQSPGILNEGYAPERDCSAAKDHGFTTSGLYKINPGDSEGEFTVFCDMQLLGGGWTVIQRRVNDSLLFNRSWVEYRNGFGNFNTNFWLGLNKIKRVSDNGNFKLYVGLEDFHSGTAYSLYGSFSLGSEASDYKLTISGYDTASTAGDSLLQHNTHPFSTVDQDNDPSSNHCAQTYKGGWWYWDCHDSNLNGVWYADGVLPVQTVPDGIIWQHWAGNGESLKTSVMAVRKAS